MNIYECFMGKINHVHTQTYLKYLNKYTFFNHGKEGIYDKHKISKIYKKS